jgi:hypothetical protein
MALWDALTGKIYHFNKTKEQATHRVRTALKTFVSSRLPKYPTGERMFLQGRNALYAYYMASTMFFSHNLDGSLAKYKKAIFSLNVHNYLCLLSALHTGHIVGVYLGERHSKAAESWFYLLSEGICDIYRRPDNYMAEWVNRLEWIAESEEVIATRLSFKVFDEIATILGLPQSDLVECLTWSQIGVECARYMRILFDQPNWADTVEAEVSAY